MPAELVKTALYSFALSEAVTLEMMRVGALAPEMGSGACPGVGGDLPLDRWGGGARRVAVPPAFTTWPKGLVVMAGAVAAGAPTTDACWWDAASVWLPFR